MFKLKSVLLLVISSVLILSFSGCGAKGYNVKAEKTQDEVIVNKSDKAYIMFGRKYGAGMEMFPIVELVPETNGIKGIVILGMIERFIVEVEPGVHYYHSFEGETDEFIKIDAKAGHLYGVNATIGMGIWNGRFYLEPVRTKALMDQLNSYPLVVSTPAAHEWFEDELDDDYYNKTESDFKEWLKEDSHEEDEHLKQMDGYKL